MITKLRLRSPLLFTLIGLLFKSTILCADPDTRPNILYIFTDDQTHRSVSAYPEAHSWVSTPNIDRLAESGMRFTTSYTGAWCQPSRASALTGLLQHGMKTLKVTDYPMATYDPEQLRFFPSVFRKHGYETACIGKWHLGEDVGHGRDWDYSVIWDRGRGPNGKRNAWAYYTDTLVRTNGGERKPLGNYSTDGFTELAVDYITKQKESEAPWYLWLCYGGVHSPFTPAERHKNADTSVPAVEIPEDIFGPRPTKPGFLKNFSRWKKDKAGLPKDFSDRVIKYHKAVRALDEGVGSLLQALEESGQLDNTIIIFTSDQGYAWGQHGLDEKSMPYDAAICAPLIFSAPGITQAGTVSSEPVNGVDIVRTIHSLAGIQPEWEMHGRDLMDILKNPDTSLSEPMLMMNSIYQYGDAVTETLKMRKEKDFKRAGLHAWIMMRDGKYKYIRYFKSGVIEELYDMENDPKELNNLSVNSEYAGKLEELRATAIEEFMKKNGNFVNYLPMPKGHFD